MRLPFLSLGRGAHPLWWTCYSSSSAVRAAKVIAKTLSGRYRSCWLRRHWTQESGACHLPSCGQVPDDVAHLLSGECPALRPCLAITLHNISDMLAPRLQHHVLSVLHGDRNGRQPKKNKMEDDLKFFLLKADLKKNENGRLH
jgi:hypothetical protein